jgi:hypothetical protein
LSQQRLEPADPPTDDAQPTPRRRPPGAEQQHDQQGHRQHGACAVPKAARGQRALHHAGHGSRRVHPRPGDIHQREDRRRHQTQQQGAERKQQGHQEPEGWGAQGLPRRRDCSIIPLHADPNRQDACKIGRTQQPAQLQRRAPPPGAELVRGSTIERFHQITSARRQTHQRKPGQQQHQQGQGHGATEATEVRQAVVTEARQDAPGHEEQRGLGQRMGADLQQRRGGGGAAGCAAGEREQQKQITELGEGRIGHQQLEPGLHQGHQVAEHNGEHPQAAEQQTDVQGRQIGHQIQPKPEQQEEGALHHQRREHRAGRRGGTAMGRRQPQMQRHQGGLREQPGAHQRHRRERGPPDRFTRCLRVGRDRHQRGSNLPDVQRPVHAEHQPRTEQVQGRTQEREQQIAERGLELLGMPLQADQRHRREGQHLDGDVEVEQIAPEEQAVESGPDAEQQGPEGERHPASDAGHAEVPRRMQANEQQQRRRQHQHQRRWSVKV